MTLAEIYRADGRQGLRKLAAACGCGEKYLYQCATGRKIVSPELAKGLIAADARLSFEDLYSDVAPRVAAREEAA